MICNTEDSKSSRPVILFVCYGGGHVAMMVPLIRLTARRHPEWKLEVLGLTVAGEVLRRRGIKSFGFSRLLDRENVRARKMGEQLAAGFASDAVAAEESIAYLGLSYCDLEARHGSQGAAESFAAAGRQAFLPVPTLEKCIELVGADLVVATSAPRAERAAILAARNASIPSVCMVDLFAIREVDWLKDPDYATRLCVLSDAVKARLVTAGRADKDIVVTGNPAFDQLDVADLPKRRKRLRKRREIDSKFVVLWASQPEPDVDPESGLPADTELPGKVERELRKIAARDKDLAVIIRYHPTQVGERFEPGAGVQFSPLSEELIDVLCVADCVLTFSSTVGLEALLLNLPLITLDMSVTCAGAPYSRFGYSYGVDRVSDLKDALDAARAGRIPHPPKLPPPGGAAALVLNEIEHLVGERSCPVSVQE